MGDESAQDFKAELELEPKSWATAPHWLSVSIPFLPYLHGAGEKVSSFLQGLYLNSHYISPTTLSGSLYRERDKKNRTEPKSPL